MKCPRYEVVKETPEYVLIKDLGPWNLYPTITNGAEEVVEKMTALGNRRLFYYDSENRIDELVHKDGKFIRFAPGMNL